MPTKERTRLWFPTNLARMESDHSPTLSEEMLRLWRILTSRMLSGGHLLKPGHRTKSEIVLIWTNFVAGASGVSEDRI